MAPFDMRRRVLEEHRGGRVVMVDTIAHVAPEDAGQIVVARLEDEVTVKRLRRRGATVELLPENPEFKAIVVDTRSSPFAIEGIAVGIIRSSRSL